jgi:RHS repeat-associated protein
MTLSSRTISGRVPGALLALMGCLGLAMSGWAQSPPDKSGVRPSVLSLPTGAGSIEGLGESFEPQLNTGGASYGVAITVPPGRAGLTPSVRLSYNSFAGNGVCGIGWSFEFMSLQRQTDKGFPEYNDGDTFLFEGEELVPLDNAERDWRCENERNFQRLRRIDSNGDGIPDAWEVTERNGTRHTLGRFRGQNQRWSVVEHPDKGGLDPFDRTYSWLVDSTTDLHGNRIEYEYVRGEGVLYPSRITYGHLDGNFHDVRFEYESRSDAFDDYRPTFSARLDRRLSRIDVLSQGEPVRSYLLAYEYAPGDITPDIEELQRTYLDLGVTLLKRVVQIGRSGNEDHYLPPLIFLYSGLDLTKSELRGFAVLPELDLADPSGRVQLADLDGDALPDLIATTAEGAGTVQRVALNRGESRLGGTPQLTFAPARIVLGSSPVDLGEANTVIHDPRGKGLVDVSSLSDDGFNKRLETFGNRASLDFVDENRLGFGLEQFESTVLENPPEFVTYNSAATRQMDTNFDKRSDFVHLSPDFGVMKVSTYYIDRNGRWVTGEAFLPPSYPLEQTFAGPDGQSNPRVHLADMNGDRLLDLICIDTEPSGAGQRLSIRYWPLAGLGRYEEARPMPTTAPDTFDIGNADLRDVFIEDFTGDGLADVLILDGSGPETVLTLRVNIAGQRWSPPYTRTGLPRYAPRDPVSPTVLRVADLNASGSLDLLFRNGGLDNSWEYLELLPTGSPNLITGIDNGLGKRTTIVYGSASEDEQLAREAGHPWRTYAPMALEVVRQVRTTSGQDLNGDGKEDSAVVEFRYRDPYYDGFERQFRGFAFAQRVDYGDDFILDPVTGLMHVSAGWNHARTPTGQVSGPSLVRRYRFHTGAADQLDNDEYGDETPPYRLIDEFTVIGGREEEPLKGLQWVEEQIDPVVLHAAHDGGFDAGCAAATDAATIEEMGRLTPDKYVYGRIRQEWTLRRLYRPTEPLPYLADQDADGRMEDYRNAPLPAVPSGRFARQGIHVLPGNGRSVSYAFLSRRVVEVREANGLLSAELDYPAAAALRTIKHFDHDDYGNQILLRDLGVDDPAYDDELVTVTTFAHGGNALALWVIDRPSTVLVTDEHGVFASRTDHYYDGDPFVGVYGEIRDRARPHRSLDYIDPDQAIQGARTRFDEYGNIVEMLDPLGNARRVEWDPTFRTFATAETLVVGGAAPDLRLEVEYDTGFGVVTASRDANGHLTLYEYDDFARLVAITGPGDTVELPTTRYEYQPADPIRGRAFVYDRAGRLTLTPVPVGSASRVVTREREVSGEPGEFITATYTDGSGNPLATIEAGEIPGTWVVTSAIGYNLRGMVQSQWLPYRVTSAEIPQFADLWPAGRPPANDGVNPAIVSTDYYYDPMGRTIRTVAPPETWGGVRLATVTQHLPLQRRLFDEEDLRPGSPHAGTPTIESFDGLGRLIAVEEQVRLHDDGNPSDTVQRWTTRYAYDVNSRLTRITDAQNNVKSMEYDGLKRKTRMDDPNAGWMEYHYDEASNLIETVDAKGQRITFTYDGLNRVLTEEFHDEVSPEFSYQRSPDVAYFYDQPAGPVDQGDGTRDIARNTKGRLAYVLDASGEEHNSYDERGRLEWMVKRVREPGAGSVSPVLTSYRTRLRHDALDRISQITYPDNDQITYHYSPRNVVERIGGTDGQDIVASLGYLPSGQIREIEYGNRVRTTYEYDPRLRMTGVRTVSEAIQGTPALVHFEYSFDGVSNVRRIEDRRDTTFIPPGDPRRNTQDFDYDDLHRLTRVQYNLPASTTPNGGEIRYRYDRIGNLLAQSSDIAHTKDDQSLTDLGTFVYGGSAGSSGRVGRTPGAAPGPHAMTAIQPPDTDARPLAYDANGNVTSLDGLTCTWDFKNRLVAVESDAFHAVYTYDYAGRRVIKQVTYRGVGRLHDTAPLTRPAGTLSPSVGERVGVRGSVSYILPSQDNPETSVAPPDAAVIDSEVVVYVGNHFEIRENEQPTKYVFNGPTRIARITGSLSDRTRVQRFRLEPGWNLVSLAITVRDALNQITDPDSTVVEALDARWIARWVDATQTWVPLTESDELPAGTVLWIHSDDAIVLALTGSYAEPVGREAPAGSSFQPGAGLEPLPLDGLAGVEFWDFDPTEQTWRTHIPAPDATERPSPKLLPPGRAFFVQTEVPVELAVPDPALGIRYYHQDHLGSSSVITDAAGELVEEIAYYPFGVVRHAHQPRAIEEPYRFAQKERDRESGLDYFEARYMTPWLGRFLSPDPKYLDPDRLSGEELEAFITRPQLMNAYAYVLNNPLRYVDPTGLDPKAASEGMVPLDDTLGVAGIAVATGQHLEGITKLKGPGVVLDVVSVGIKTYDFAKDPSAYNGVVAGYTAGKALLTAYAPPVGIAVQALDTIGIGPAKMIDMSFETIQGYRQTAEIYRGLTQSYTEMSQRLDKLSGEIQAETDRLRAETRRMQAETRKIQEQIERSRESIRRTDELLRRTDDLLRSSK